MSYLFNLFLAVQESINLDTARNQSGKSFMVGVWFLAIILLTIPRSSFAEEILWLDGRLPGTSDTEGTWVWDENMKRGDVISHTDNITEGLHSHSFRTDTSVALNSNSKIIQHLFLDPKNKPAGIMIKFLLQDSEEISVYWEGEKEVFVDTNEYITSWYMGQLPEDNRWISLTVDFKEMDITEVKLEGISFITNGGRLWWGETVIIHDKS